MRVARVVVHLFAGRALHGAREQVVNPVGAAHPGTVTAVGFDEARAHRQQVFNGDRALARIGARRDEVRKVGSDRRADARQKLAVDGDADQRGDDALRSRLHVGIAGGARAVEVTLEDRLTVLARQQAVKARHAFAGLHGVIEGGRGHCRDRKQNAAEKTSWHRHLPMGHYTGPP